MMYWMDSKVFQNEFLTNERDDDILEAQYVIISTRIRKKNRKWENIINAQSMLYPDTFVYSSLDEETIMDRYYSQCGKAVAFLATLIKGSIEEGFNIIFISTKKELKVFNYLSLLSTFIWLEFKYPVYNYSTYINGEELKDWDPQAVLKKCNKVLKKAKNKRYQDNLQSDQGKKEIMKEMKELKKKELKKILEKKGLYKEGMDKEDMLDLIEVFL